MLILVGVAALSSTQPAQAQSDADPIPVLAYYYIWFDPTSWDRAKDDYPLLGHYSSDDRLVMERHIEWAKEAGIDGFIVSWKSTPALNRRLEQLIEVANERSFKLAIIYQGLDFDRDPLPVDQVAFDFDYVAERWGSNPAFDLFGKPLVIWSGTWEFSAAEISTTTLDLRDRLLILASEKAVDGYERLADYVEGNAYYWSSVNPDTFPGYPDKLIAMGDAVHETGGIWIPPAAPGYDGRILGSERVVDRASGDMLRRQLNGAMASNPDAIGIISWNEFSEGTQIEPSERYGDRELTNLAAYLGATPPKVPDFASDDPSGRGAPVGLLAIGAMMTIVAGSAGLMVFRNKRSQR